MNKQALKELQKSAQLLSETSEEARNACLLKLGKIIHERRQHIIEANKKDLLKAKKEGMAAPMIERLKLDSKGIIQMLKELRAVGKLHSGVGRIIEKKKIKKGLVVNKMAVPLGVILVIYESRPEVTVEVAALCIKSGNGAVLKGGSEALNTNRELCACIARSLKESGMSEKTVTCIETRQEVNKIMREDTFIDLVIARGGYDLVKAVQKQSLIPVLAHSAGGARIYIDQSADLAIARRIIINAKTSKPSACNALDAVVVHQAVAGAFVPMLTKDLFQSGVRIMKGEKAYKKEFLDLKIAIKIVKNLEEAIVFINRYGKKHSEGIIAADKKVIETFTHAIDAAAIFVNCSTRLHDGYVFGLGAEMGIATGKLHGRGPIGLQELLTYKWKMYGNGQIRE